ncbi:MAG: hypothetical protein PHE84_05500 [bacterium]|nr:hypothetical protein [bacterium]
MIFLLVACPSAWLFRQELRTVKTTLGIGREGKIENWSARMNETGDTWMKWKYCREILALDPKNSLALFWKGQIAREYAQKAQDLISRHQAPEAINTLVLAIRVDPQIGYLRVWMEDWMKDQADQKQPSRSTPQPAGASHR